MALRADKKINWDSALLAGGDYDLSKAKADVLALDDGELVPLASRLRAGFGTVAQALPSK